MISINEHGGMIHDDEVGKDIWVRQHNQLRRRLAEPTYDKRHLSFHPLLDTINVIRVPPPPPPRSPVKHQIMILTCVVRTRPKPTSLQADLSSKTNE